MKSLVSFIKESVTNHLTPINNIMVNVKNIFCQLGLVCEIQDNSLIIKSSRFNSYENVTRMLYNWDIVRGTSLQQYIVQQGLNDIQIVPFSQTEWMLVCKATDIETPDKYINNSIECEV